MFIDDIAGTRTKPSIIYNKKPPKDIFYHDDIDGSYPTIPKVKNDFNYL